MKIIFLLLFSFAYLFSYSQESLKINRTYSDTIPNRLRINSSIIRDHVYSQIPSYSKKGKYETMTYTFADKVGSQVSNLLTQGKVYTDWAELELYVNRILLQIMPEELKKDTSIHAYIYKDGAVNAFMTPSGQFIVNIGLISRCNDEATLAAVLAHELAHYYKQHSLKSYIQSELGNFDTGIATNDKLKNSMSIKQEIEADSIAMNWIKNSNYSLMGVLKTHKMLERDQQRQLLRLENEWILKHSTHPLSKDRVTNFYSFYKKNKNLNNNLFLINEELFNKFKELAKKESLKFLLDDVQYYECLELAFKFHLMDPDNQTYIYFLMESIRKICYINNDTWDQNFITNRYYDTVRVQGVKRKHKVKKGLFDDLDFNILPISQEEAKYIKARFYWEGQNKFKTYNEAFEFYSSVGKALNCKECILTNALSITGDKNVELRNKYLKEYLSYKDIDKRDFAENLKEDKCVTNLPKKKLLIFSDFFAGIRQGNNRIPINNLSEDTTNTLNYIFDSLKTTYPERDFIFLPDIKSSNISDYKLFVALENLTFNNMISLASGAAGEKRIYGKINNVKLHILEPNYLNLYRKYGVNEIEFLNCFYTESRKKDHSLEFYKNTRDINYQDFFKREKCTKSIHVIITSLRIIKGKRLKIRAFGKEESMKFKEPSYNQIISELRYKIRYKEKVARENDNRDEEYKRRLLK